MAVLDAIVLSQLAPSDLLGLELHFLDAVGSRRSRPVLILYALAGRLASLGRYHLYGGPEESVGVRAYRRLTGGRIAGAGEGWFGIALILPTRSALLHERDSKLKPEQVMNRYARGAIGGLRAAGLDCFYPGRDALTFKGREIAMCSFETDASGAMLFEVSIAAERGMEDLVHDLERFDPNGELTCPMYDCNNSTTLARELGHGAGFAELSRALERGYAELLGEIQRRELTPEEESDARRRAGMLLDSGWLNERKLDRALNRIAVARSQLGMVEAHLKFRDGDTIERLMLSGDFIANSPGLARLEAELAGKPFDLRTVTTSAVRTFADGSNYILGVGDLANVVRLVMKAA